MNKLNLVITLIFLNFFFFTEPSFSMCKLDNQYVIPTSGSQYHGGLILFHSELSTKSLPNRDPRSFSLRSKKHKVLLNVLYSNNSEFLLKPSMKLQKGKKYTLYEGDDEKPFHWAVKNSKGKEIEPQIISSPEFVDFKSNIGCGGSIKANFSLQTIGASFILAELVADKTDNIQTQIITRFDKNISIIESLCGGGVHFTPQIVYKARFKVISDDGKESSFSEYVSFTAPDSFEEKDNLEVSKPALRAENELTFWNKFLRFFGGHP
jgi:hypothetical protein